MHLLEPVNQTIFQSSKKNDLGRSAKEGYSPVFDRCLFCCVVFSSRVGHVKSGLNLGGPSSKTKYCK